MYAVVVMSSGELYHHGILGQKWGQRNGPPYPLGASDHSAREKAAGYTKSIKKAHSEYTKSRNERYKQYKNTRSELLKERKANAKALKENRNKYENDHSAKEKYKSDLKKVASDVKNDVKENVKSIDKDKVLKVAKIGATVAIAGLAVYGGYKLYKAVDHERNKLSPYALHKLGIKTFRPDTFKTSMPSGVRSYGKTVFENGKVTYEVNMEDGRQYVKEFFDDLKSSGKGTDYQDADVWKALFGFDPYSIERRW